MKLAVVYEKVETPNNNDTYILKPVEGIIGECDEKGVFHTGDWDEKGDFHVYEEEEFYSYTDANNLRNEENCIFYGNTIDVTQFAKQNNFNYGTPDYNYSLSQYYYEKYHSNLLAAKITDDEVHVDHVDLGRIPDCIVKEGVDKFVDENPYIAVLYKKKYVMDGVKYIYSMVPEEVIFGNYDEDADVLVSGDNIYHPLDDKDAVDGDETLFFDGVHLLDDLITITSNTTMEDLNELKEKFRRSNQYHVNFIMNGSVIQQMRADFQSVVRYEAKKENTEEDEIIKETIDGALTMLDGELTDANKKLLFEFYRLLARFLYAEGSINNIKLSDVSYETYSVCSKGYVEIVRALDSLGIRDELSHSNAKIDSKEAIVEKTYVNDFSKPKFPEQSFDDIYSGITRVVIGQDKHVEKIVSVLYKRMIEINLNKDIPSRFGLIVTGSPGSGKSEIFNQFAKIVNVPIQFVDSTQMTEAGYAGMGAAAYMEKLYRDYKGDMKKISDSFIVFDELDKIKEHKGEQGADVNGKGAQDSLLKFMDGTDYDLSQLGMGHPNVTINTSRMTPIAIGAFAELLREEIMRIKAFGDKSDSSEKQDKILTTDDLIEYGMGDQLMGRLYVDVQLDRLNVPALVRVMDESANSPLLVQQAIFNAMGVDIIFEDGYKQAIAQKAYDAKIGCRALYKYIADTTYLPIPEISRNMGKYKKLILTSDTVKDKHNYKLLS